MMNHSWDPNQYNQFSKEREQPFWDLIKLVEVHPKMTILDLGCGDGALTQMLHQNLKAKETLGIDSSKDMLKQAFQLKDKGLEFRQEDISHFKTDQSFDLIFSNAALQWVPEHYQLFKKLKSYLTECGQLAVQMPANFDYLTHQIAQAIAGEDPFRQKLAKVKHQQPSILKLEEYAEMLYWLGFKKQHLRIQMYAHQLASTESVIEWVKGSLMTYYRSHLSKEHYAMFLDRYEQRVMAFLENRKPFLMPFKRLLLWAN